MKANEYFKKHGYRKCKSACVENGWLNTGFWIQLKHLVASHELVQSYGGLDKTKKKLSTEQSEPYYNYSQQLVDSLKQAIADVESCQ